MDFRFRNFGVRAAYQRETDPHVRKEKLKLQSTKNAFTFRNSAMTNKPELIPIHSNGTMISHFRVGNKVPKLIATAVRCGVESLMDSLTGLGAGRIFLKTSVPHSSIKSKDLSIDTTFS